ncbi:hypothetical protein CEXT_493291 [Caerostris extrusa]|uniref:Uncharacterized protein n=1 Tax=Caerostris extrusa TaxID=172846 RepID=A0AAV4XVH5_CAEEX|nr:hypothetical protein CEXT_493291 [Caerostris extrusa]
MRMGRPEPIAPRKQIPWRFEERENLTEWKRSFKNGVGRAVLCPCSIFAPRRRRGGAANVRLRKGIRNNQAECASNINQDRGIVWVVGALPISEGRIQMSSATVVTSGRPSILLEGLNGGSEDSERMIWQKGRKKWGRYIKH